MMVAFIDQFGPAMLASAASAVPQQTKTVPARSRVTSLLVPPLEVCAVRYPSPIGAGPAGMAGIGVFRRLIFYHVLAEREREPWATE